MRGDPAWRPLDEPAYCYLLGLYLGDGCITTWKNHAWIAHCDLLGLRWTQSNWRNISIAHRDSVAVLDSFIGPKR